MTESLDQSRDKDFFHDVRMAPHRLFQFSHSGLRVNLLVMKLIVMSMKRLERGISEFNHLDCICHSKCQITASIIIDPAEWKSLDEERRSRAQSALLFLLSQMADNSPSNRTKRCNNATYIWCSDKTSNKIWNESVQICQRFTWYPSIIYDTKPTQIVLTKPMQSIQTNGRTWCKKNQKPLFFDIDCDCLRLNDECVEQSPWEMELA
jgi:hypothetical protein